MDESSSQISATVFTLANHWQVRTPQFFQNPVNIFHVSILNTDYLKVGLAPSKKHFSTSFNDSPSKMMKNAFYFILKALFVLKIFKYLS